MRIAKEEEFVHFNRENRTIVAYKVEFSEFLKFCINLVADEESRVQRFQVGITPKIRCGLTAFELPMKMCGMKLYC